MRLLAVGSLRARPGPRPIIRVGKVWPPFGIDLARKWLGCGQTDQFVEFTSVQPHAPALGAVINLHTLAIGHQQRAIGANGTFHEDFQ